MARSADPLSNNIPSPGCDQHYHAYATHCYLDPGETLRTSILAALNMINQQQHLLPGYEVKVEFMDGRRDKVYTLRKVLAKVVFNDA